MRATAADAIRLKTLKDAHKIYCQIIRLGQHSPEDTPAVSGGGVLGSAFALKSLSGPVQQSRAAALEG